MGNVDDHATLVRRLLQFELGTETLPLAEALGRLTATATLSPVDLPLFRNAHMDGFAVYAADVASIPVTLPVVGEVAARAAAPAALEPGTAVRIMTGAVVPDGADAVIPVEDTTVDENAVSIHRSRTSGEYVRERGSDARAGDLLLPPAQLLSSRHLAVLAAAGIPTVEVVARVRVAVVTTGAELVEPGDPVEPGQVYDANAVALIAAVAETGAVVTFVRRVADQPELLLSALSEAASDADLILTSGGISRGDYEVVRELLEPRGAHIAHLAMQPGGPQATALFEGTPVICFPGNPVSTQLSFEVFVAPVLRELAGISPKIAKMRLLAVDLRSVPGKRQFLRGRVTGEDRVETVSGPGSHLVAGLAASDVLIVVPEDVTELHAGDEVETLEL